MSFVAFQRLTVGFSIDEAPAVGIEASELLLDGEKLARIAHRCRDLQPISNDRRVLRQCLNPLVGVARNLLRIEAAESATVAFALLEHDRPAQPRLRRFEHQKLEMLAIIVNGHAPFAIVILEH